MKKYLFIFKATFMESLQYVMNIILGFITFFIVLYVFLNLWDYIYSDSASLISGYSKNQMIWYVILTEIMWFGTRNRTLTNQIANDIKSGAIAYGINKPYNYIFYMIARNLGEIAIKFVLFLGAGIIIGYTFVGGLPGFRFVNLPFIVIPFLIGMLINSFLQMSISVLSFWIEDSTPFQWIYDKMIIVLGILFPIEMFPGWAQPIMKLTPIFVVTYAPAKLVIDFNIHMFLNVLLIQGIYAAVSFVILMGLYQKGVKRLNVNGG
ncbi:MAG TPA: ABC transporter permease [Mobilitalea sp.]|nr:ABC transporter permease [Mobilitalea sp.]